MMVCLEKLDFFGDDHDEREVNLNISGLSAALAICKLYAL